MLNMLLPVITPLLLGAALPLFRFRTSRGRGIYAVGAAALTSLMVLCALVTRQGVSAAIFPMTERLSIVLHIDGMTTVFAGLLAFLWPLATLYGVGYMEHEQRRDSFFAFYLISYGVSLAVSMAANLFTMYVFYECLTLATLPLVIHKKDPQSIHAGRKYLYYSIGGAALAFVALIISMNFGTLADFTLGGTMDPAKTAGSEDLIRFAFLAAFIGFGTKAAMFPMYPWLPAASVAPTPVTALLHAVAVVNTGVFAVGRMTYYTFGTELLRGSVVQDIALLLSAFSVLFGAVMALREQHLKRRLAYSTMSNLSYMLVGMAIMSTTGLMGALIHMVFHGLIKIVLFFAAGAILVQTGKEYLQDLRGFWRVMPMAVLLLLLPGIALMGVPPFPGFLGKFTMMTAAAQLEGWRGLVAAGTLVTAGVLTAGYMLGAVVPMISRPLRGEDGFTSGGRKDAGWLMALPMILITLVMMAGGFLSGSVTSLLSGMIGH